LNIIALGFARADYEVEGQFTVIFKAGRIEKPSTP
jgi:hypothetical protein